MKIVKTGVVILLTALLATSSFAVNFSVIDKPTTDKPAVDVQILRSPGSPQATYDGTLRIYIAEKVSRYRDLTGHSYEFGFLDFALIDTISISDQGTWQQTIRWDGPAAGYSGITEHNITATAVVFSMEGVLKDAYPNKGYWFSAYYAEGAAQAVGRTPGRNYRGTEYTHTAFVEEGTATW